MHGSPRTTHVQALGRRFRHRGPPAIAVAVLLSALFHGTAALGIAWIPRMPPPPPPDRVLQVAFVSQGEEPGDKQTEPTSKPETPTPPTAQPQPQPAAPPSTDPPLPEVRFPALQAAARHPVSPSVVQAPAEFSEWQKRRYSALIPGRIPDGGGSPDGLASVDSEGRDRCIPVEGRALDRLYLLFDSSGSMSSQLRAQALSCAQQYAQAAIDQGAEVVVGNFAARSEFHPPTRNMTDVAIAIRGDVDARATVLPSSELNPFFEQDLGAVSDLVILSDGYIPNTREALHWYEYFIEINPENRGYMYTLGTPGHPEVTEALRRIGFEIYVYRIL